MKSTPTNLVRSSSTLLLLIASVTSALLLVQTTLNRAEPVSIGWSVIPAEIPLGAPFFAWLQLTESKAEPVFLQLRICSQQGVCVHSSRQEVRGVSKPALVTATRDLEPGPYRIQILVQTRTPLNVIRTVAIRSGETQYGH